MQVDPLNLSHQNLLEQRFRLLDLPISEYSFANLYLFRHIHEYQVLKYREEVFIKGKTRDQVSFIMLTSHPSKLSSQLLRTVVEEAEVLFPIPESWLPFFEKILLQSSFNEADSDYLYMTSKLAHFPGRYLHKKRNLVGQLLHEHDVRGEDLSSHLNEAEQILEFWKEEYGDDFAETDYFACQEAIQLFQSLHLHGRIIYVDQRPAGFTIGEWTSKDCYTVHFSKADRKTKGLYQYAYQDLGQLIEETTAWINLEQDLGIPALRNSKHSYLPDQLLHKWRVQLAPF
jgi:hypothetical protein